MRPEVVTTMDHTDRRARFRALLQGDRCVQPASVFDPISIRLAEHLGFEVAVLGGSVASLTVLGAPDLTLVTLSELTEQVRRLCRVSELPLLVDADHGFGNALNVKRTVEELENAGAAAVTIEDTALPLPFGAVESPLVSVAEGVGKVRAAVAGRADPALVIAARTSVTQHADLDETRERAKAYESAGADALFLVGIRTEAQLATIAADMEVPLIIASTASELADPAVLVMHGARVQVGGHRPIEAAIAATHRALQRQRDGLPVDVPLPADELVGEMSRRPDYSRWSASFLQSAEDER